MRVQTWSCAFSSYYFSDRIIIIEVPYIFYLCVMCCWFEFEEDYVHYRHLGRFLLPARSLKTSTRKSNLPFQVSSPCVYLRTQLRLSLVGDVVLAVKRF